jgi:hypothetical protein
VSSHSAASGSTAAVAAAFTPPTQATASPDSAAARRGDPVRAPVTSGTSTHGASAIGSTSTEMAPSPLVIRGASAYARPPSSTVVGLPIRSRRASATTPRNATLSSSVHHSRWTTQEGTPSRWPRAKNGPIGKR